MFKMKNNIRQGRDCERAPFTRTVNGARSHRIILGILILSVLAPLGVAHAATFKLGASNQGLVGYWSFALLLLVVLYWRHEKEHRISYIQRRQVLRCGRCWSTYRYARKDARYAPEKHCRSGACVFVSGESATDRYSEKPRSSFQRGTRLGTCLKCGCFPEGKSLQSSNGSVFLSSIPKAVTPSWYAVPVAQSRYWWSLYIQNLIAGRREPFTNKLSNISTKKISSRCFTLIKLASASLLLLASCFLLPTSAFAATLKLGASNAGLVGYWSFNEGTGTIAHDFSGHGNNGTLSGSTLPTWTSGKLGNGLSFNGTSSRVNLAPVSVGASVTISAWIRTSSSGQIPAFSLWGGDRIYYGVTSGTFFVYDNNATPSAAMTSNAYVNNNQWHLVVWTNDGANSNMYVDGRLDKTQSQARGAFTGTAGSYIGFDGPNSEYFPGSIDEVRVYNRALSSAEVFALYISGAAKVISGTSPKLISGLVGWWDASDADTVRSTSSCTGSVSNGGTIGCLEDRSGNGNNMTQPTGGQQPTYQFNIKSGNSVVRFAAAASQTISTATNFPAPATVIYVSHLTGGTNGRLLSGKANNWLLGYWGGAKDQAFFNGWVSPSGTPAADTSWHTYSAVIPGSGSSSFYGNSTLIASNASGVAGPNGLAIGYLGAGEFSDGEIGEILVYNRALSDSERLAVERYLSDKWGVNYTGFAPASKITVNASSQKLQAGSSLAQGLVGYWTFDGSKTQSTIADSSGYGNNGYFIGGATSSAKVAGKLGQALKFNGSGTYIDTGSNSITGTSPFTISAWINTSVGCGYSGAVSMGASLTSQSAYIGTVGTAQVGTSCSIGGGFYGHNYGTGVTASNQWVHEVMTFSGGSGGTTILYINGVNKVSSTYTPNLASTYRRIGRIASDTSYDFNGSIDDVRIYNRALSAAEVQQLYNMGK
jgi:hypothetical protein